jgi:Holliday junction resolvase RusA-like endonuclease
MADCEITVFGVPSPQGNKTAYVVGKRITWRGQYAVVNPRAVIVEGRAIRRKDGTLSQGRVNFKRWRADVERAARSWAFNAAHAPIAGPLRVGLTFYLPRPISIPRHTLYPTKKPDVDKLARAVLDSLKGSAIDDDSDIIVLVVQKLYAPEGCPRVEIAIERMPATAQELRQLQLVEEPSCAK